MVGIRAVRATDSARLRELRLRALTNAPQAFSSTAEQEAELPESHWSELAQQSEAGESAIVLVAIDGDRWVGMAAGRWFDRERGIAHLWGMWVDPEQRRLGIGERLVADVREWAASHGARFLRLGVISHSAAATPFYEGLGFVRTGEHRALARDETTGAFFLARPV
jgi:ribosomal protein S18 acetylase RimI-like enzyme